MIEGQHGIEGCYAAIRVGDRFIGSPERAGSYPANPWEYSPRRGKTGYSHFFPLDESMVEEELEVILLGMKGGGKSLQPSV